ncbi:MAG: LysR family transcriptional regulator [Thermoguttaceae bacterium]|nr:LysR family transcriptional regulator [Thermoguttaceae bacterium]
MKIDSLRVFCDVALHQSFSRGAELNQISQSAATQTIQRLEEKVGVPLIDRAKRPFCLTPEGKICYETFRQVVESYDSVVHRVRAMRHRDEEQIKVAAIYSVGLNEMSRFMKRFMLKYPKVKVKLDYMPPQKVQQSVLDSEVDMGIISYPIASLDIDVIPLRAEEMSVILPVGHPLSKRTALRMEDLQGSDFVAFGRELVIRRETDHCLRTRQVRVNIVTEFDNIQTIKEAVEIGMGISIVPYPTVRLDAENGKIAAVPLISPRMTRPIGIIYRHHKVLSETAINFIEMLTGAPFQVPEPR